MDQAVKARWRLLPETDHLGWTPYMWLVYLVFYLADPAIRLHRGTLSAASGVAVLVGLVVFLVVYFRGYWATGRALLGIIAVHVILGVALTPVTFGASVFFSYAASFAGNLETTRVARRVILLIVGTAILAVWLAGVPMQYAVPSAAMALMIGFINMHYAEGRRANARLRLAQSQVAQLATVAERERIARDLHDVLGHTLSLIVLKAELARKLMTRDIARAEEEIRDVERVSRDALREVREAISGYRASLLEEVARARALLQVGAITPDMNVDLAGLPYQYEDAVALAIREGVTNVVRHAQATRCWVEVAQRGDHWLIAIEDDGVGRMRPEGAGLRGMRERVEALGGTIAQLTGRAGGLRHEIRLPGVSVAREFVA